MTTGMLGSEQKRGSSTACMIGVMRYDMVWCDVACGVMWCDAVWRGVMWHGAVWCDVMCSVTSCAGISLSWTRRQYSVHSRNCWCRGSTRIRSFTPPPNTLLRATRDASQIIYRRKSCLLSLQVIHIKTGTYAQTRATRSDCLACGLVSMRSNTRRQILIQHRKSPPCPPTLAAQNITAESCNTTLATNQVGAS